MNSKHAYMALVFILVLAGCKSSPTQPTQTDPWSFPASSKFAVTLYTDKSTISVGQTTDIKLVLYDVTNVFGAAIELRLPLDSLEVIQVVQNPNILDGANALVLSKVDSTQGKVSYGVTLKAGSNATFTGSAVVCKATVKGLIAGPVNVRITPGMLSLVKSDGQPITNFASIAIENLALTVN